MSELIENHDGPSKTLSNSENASETVKMLRTFCRNDNKFRTSPGDDNAWLANSQRDSHDIENLETSKLAEFKYKNVYSVSVPNSHLSTRNSRRSGAIAGKARVSSETLEISRNFIHNEEFDALENATTPNDFLDSFRDYLANYQLSNGTPMGEYSFVTLMKTMGRATGQSLIALFYIVVNVMPLIQLFLFVTRFVLDKLISIRNTGYARQSFVKYAIFAAQLACIYVCLVFILGFVFMPILHLVLAIVAKILLIN